MKPAATPTPRSIVRRVLTWIGLGVVLGGYFSLSTCSPPQDAMQQVRILGTLRVAMTNSPTTYYVSGDGETGYEYDLAKALAERLEVKLEVVLAESAADAIRMVQQGRAHFAAAAVTVSENRAELVRFTAPVQKVVPQLVYRTGAPKPRDLGDLHGMLTVASDSVHAERLRQLQKTVFPGLQWKEAEDQVTEDLLYAVANDELAYTVANSDLLAINQRYYPNLRVAFPIAVSEDIAWAFPKSDDDSLFGPTVEYLGGLDREELARIRERHFGHVEQIDAFGALTLATHVETRLPQYRKHFEEAATKESLDWRLLAAMGYQESQWNPRAVSPTGVRGLMQLTMATASFMKLTNREDPVQSIRGGAGYFRYLMEQLPPEIQQPDRTWMGLASYNLGIGHLLDARELTRRNGGDPDHWIDVRPTLALLTKPRWHAKTRYGYARGYEAMTYVGNIRTYYDMLAFLTGEPTIEQAAPPAEAPKQEKDPLNIDSPLL
ncbi:MAG TPA: membrane-bound lytic murein transglycosylase MltF [Solimonas sp.]|nr:membrane-bound lytic murein transglycosylase MltF [Solimonas sp.]